MYYMTALEKIQKTENYIMDTDVYCLVKRYGQKGFVRLDQAIAGEKKLFAQVSSRMGNKTAAEKLGVRFMIARDDTVRMRLGEDDALAVRYYVYTPDEVVAEVYAFEFYEYGNYIWKCEGEKIQTRPRDCLDTHSFPWWLQEG